MKKKILVAIISILSITILSTFIVINLIPVSENLQFYDWHKTWGDGGGDSGYSICSDENGSVYVAGSSYDTGVLSPIIIQYDQSGKKIRELTWSERDFLKAIIIDNESNFYVGGNRYDPSFDNSSFMLMKLNKSNYHEWAIIWGTSDYSSLNDIGIDSLGDVYVIGWVENLNILRKYTTNGNFIWETSWVRHTSYISGKIDIDLTNNIYVTGTIDDEMFLAKYNSTGDLDWYKTFGADNQRIRSYDVVIDSFNNIFTCGFVNILGEYESDVFMAKFNASGDQMWNKTWGGSGYEQAHGIDVDLNGHIYITGYTTSYEYQKLFVLKYNDKGTKMWSNVLDFSVEDFGRDIVVNSLGDIYVAGDTYTLGGNRDILIVKMSSIPPTQIPGYEIFPILIVSTITLIIIGFMNRKLGKKKF